MIKICKIEQLKNWKVLENDPAEQSKTSEKARDKLWGPLEPSRRLTIPDLRVDEQQRLQPWSHSEDAS